MFPFIPKGHSLLLPEHLLPQKQPFQCKLYRHLLVCTRASKWKWSFWVGTFLTFLLSTGSFSSVNKYASISSVLKKCLLWTLLPLTALSPFLCIAFHQNSSTRLSIFTNASLPFHPKPTPVRLLPSPAHRHCSSRAPLGPLLPNRAVNSQVLIYIMLNSPELVTTPYSWTHFLPVASALGSLGFPLFPLIVPSVSFQDSSSSSQPLNNGLCLKA